MTSGLVALTVIVCGLLGVPTALADLVPVDPPAQPNIVVFYMDDVSPHDGGLWSNPDLTPTLHDLFIAHGIHFTNSIGETPLCCPGRVGLLTGLHTHNHGVIVNDGRLFRPKMHIGKALGDAGYTTVYIGKYLNLNNRLTPRQWVQHGAGWTYLDAIVGANGAYYDYTVQTKQGLIPYGHVHSTRMVAERAVARLHSAPADAPVFAVLSVFNMHGPNTPMPEFKSDARCDTFPPWRPGNYNEADVSDKPPLIANLPLLPDLSGWPLDGYCREILGIDWLVKTVIDELAAEGRLANTLLVFTADNGMTWGAHRIGQKKVTPYSTPVPLYMSWPSRWGDEPRDITDHVVNIDLAPTFCALAGETCSLGPFPTGQEHPDGVSLLPLLDDPRTVSLGRDAVLESVWLDDQLRETFGGLPSWHALRTTAANPLGLWHYVEYDDGFRELYDLSTDPWELENRAADLALRDLRVRLANRLAELRQEGRVASTVRCPDGSIALAEVGAFKGRNVYGAIPKKSQTQRVVGVTGDSIHEFTLRVTNHEATTADFLVRGTSSGSTTITVRYLAAGVDITAQVNAGTYEIDNVMPGASVELTLRMTVDRAPSGAKRAAVVTISSAYDANRLDVLKAVTVR